MEASFPIAHARMLAYEGGYSDHPADPGGVTLEGVIQSVYNDYRKSKGLPRRALTPAMRGTAEWKAERDDIYRSRYWHPPRCGTLPAGVDAAIYDYSVNSGIGRSRKVLQRLVGVPATGVIDQATLAAVAKRDPKQLVDAICDERLKFLQGLKTWPVFGGGWGKRVTNVRAYASVLAMSPAAPVAVEVPRQAPGKGEIPEPTVAKGAVKSGAPAGGVIAGVSMWDWVVAHPAESAAIALLIVAGAVLLVRAISRWHRSRQEAPTPGVGVVPELAAA